MKTQVGTGITGAGVFSVLVKKGALVSEKASTNQFARYEIEGLTLISALILHPHRGICMLEFEDGSFYVGQAQDVVTRFAQHRHGHTTHFAAWEDNVAIRFMYVPQANSLDEPVRNEIARLKSEGKHLRNKTFTWGTHSSHLSMR